MAAGRAVIALAASGAWTMALRWAVANNADWCGLVCRAHGIATRIETGFWVAAERSPELYLDAVTLSPGVEVGEVLEAVDDGPGCSVKDSFADLDLGPYGFEELFEARDPLGFRDGTHNLRRPRDLDRCVWIDRGDRSAMTGGTYRLLGVQAVGPARGRAVFAIPPGARPGGIVAERLVTR